MKKLLFSGMLMGCSVATFAQPDIGSLQDPHNASNAARHLPTYLGDRFNRFQVNLFNPYVSLGSNFATVSDAREYLTADKITSQLIGSTIDKMRSQENMIGASLDISILNAAINIPGRGGQKLFSIGFGVNERVEVSSVFNQETFLLAYSGNKQFAGKTIEIAPRFNGLAFTEYYISAAWNIQPRFSDLIIKPAVRLSYLNGQASVYMANANSISLYTEPEGRYLDFGLDYNINTSLGGDSVKLDGSSFNLNDKSVQNGNGSGFGMDIGLRVSPRPGIQINATVMDIGSIEFTKNATNIYNHSTYRYEGQELTFAENQSVNLDSLAAFARPKYSYNSFTVELPTKLVLSGSVGMGRQSKGKGSYYRSTFTGMYVQGFTNYLTATTVPYVALGYTRSFGGTLNLGANVGFGGLWGVHAGLLASVKAGPLLFGLRTNNILPVIAGDAGRGADLGMLLGLSF